MADEGQDRAENTTDTTATKEPDEKPPYDREDPDADDDAIEPDDDWKAKARKHERAAKRERKAREETEAKLRERQDQEKSEQERAIEQARREEREAANTEHEKERRSIRLENAATRLASRGIKTGSGDDAKTVRFADPDDALLRVERAVRQGDLEADDLFDSEGRVNQDALTTALRDILSDSPHLAADGERPKPSGDADTRKGAAASKDLEAMSPEDHAKRRYGTQ